MMKQSSMRWELLREPHLQPSVCLEETVALFVHVFVWVLCRNRKKMCPTSILECSWTDFISCTGKFSGLVWVWGSDASMTEQTTTTSDRTQPRQHETQTAHNETSPSTETAWIKKLHSEAINQKWAKRKTKWEKRYNCTKDKVKIINTCMHLATKTYWVHFMGNATWKQSVGWWRERTLCYITDTDVYPAEMYRKLWSPQQTSPTSFSKTSNYNEIRPGFYHDILTHTLNTLVYFSFKKHVRFSRSIFKQPNSGKLCGKKMTQGVFVKTNLHFYHLPWTDQLPLPKGNFLVPWQQTHDAPSIPTPGSLFVPLQDHSVHYQLQGHELKAGSSWNRTSVVNMPSQSELLCAGNY